MPRDHQGDLGRGRQRRLLRGHPRALEAVPVRLLPQHHVLAADARLRAAARGAGAGARLRAAAPAALVLDRLPRHLPTGCSGAARSGCRSSIYAGFLVGYLVHRALAGRRLRASSRPSPRCSRPSSGGSTSSARSPARSPRSCRSALHAGDLQALRRLHAVGHHRHDRHRLLAAARHPAGARPAVGHVHRQVALGRLHRVHPRRAADHAAARRHLPAQRLPAAGHQLRHHPARHHHGDALRRRLHGRDHPRRPRRPAARPVRGGRRARASTTGSRCGSSSCRRR